MKFTILVHPSLVIDYTLSLFDIYMPGSREEDCLRNNEVSLYDLYGHALAQEPLPRGS